jgi:hypothetical protein
VAARERIIRIWGAKRGVSVDLLKKLHNVARNARICIPCFIYREYEHPKKSGWLARRAWLAETPLTKEKAVTTDGILVKGKCFGYRARLPGLFCFILPELVLIH